MTDQRTDLEKGNDQLAAESQRAQVANATLDQKSAGLPSFMRPTGHSFDPQRASSKVGKLPKLRGG